MPPSGVLFLQGLELPTELLGKLVAVGTLALPNSGDAGAVASGDPSVFIDGFPVARVGDLVNFVAGVGVIIDGAPDILINGVPAAVVGSMISTTPIDPALPPGGVILSGGR